jgi:hypothetical protein
MSSEPGTGQGALLQVKRALWKAIEDAGVRNVPVRNYEQHVAGLVERLASLISKDATLLVGSTSASSDAPNRTADIVGNQ